MVIELQTLSQHEPSKASKSGFHLGASGDAPSFADGEISRVWRRALEEHEKPLWLNDICEFVRAVMAFLYVLDAFSVKCGSVSNIPRASFLIAWKFR